MQNTSEIFYCENTFTFDFDFDVEKKSDEELDFFDDLEISSDPTFENCKSIIKKQEINDFEINKKNCLFFKEIHPQNIKAVSKVLFF
jgi:hypothetical protein